MHVELLDLLEALGVLICNGLNRHQRGCEGGKWVGVYGMRRHVIVLGLLGRGFCISLTARGLPSRTGPTFSHVMTRVQAGYGKVSEKGITAKTL